MSLHRKTSPVRRGAKEQVPNRSQPHNTASRSWLGERLNQPKSSSVTYNGVAILLDPTTQDRSEHTSSSQMLLQD
jgi:hypothetical protein